MSPDAIQLRRQLRQKLEGLRRAGLTHLPRRNATAGRVEQDLNGAPHIEAPPAQAAGSARPSQKAVQQALLIPLEPSPNAKAAPIETPSPTLTRSDRCASLAQLAGRVAACTRCRELADTRTQTVFGVGNPEAKIVFIGEAPGADEDRQGEPFVGRAGQLLNKIIEACRMKREDVYICNVLKCRPPNNRTPGSDEAANCREYLEGQLATIDPDYIVCWGSVAAQNLLDTTASIGKMRGKLYRFGRAKVVCTYHPSYLLRNPAAKKDVWDDMKFFMRDMGVDLE